MDVKLQILQKFQDDASGKQVLEFLSNMNEEIFSNLLSEAWKIRQENFDSVLNTFYPGKSFPAISITGVQCALNCKHCNKHYLALMTHAETPIKLWELCEELNREGKIGVLLSGGYDKEAMVPFTEFLPIIKRIKEKTNLILNVHTGLVNEEIAMQLGEAGVDIVSFDIVGDKTTIHEVYGLEKTPEDYFKSIKFLTKSKIPYIVPHICIGLKQGTLSGEIRALKLISSTNPSLIVLLGLVPTIDTPMQEVTPNAQNIAKIIATTRILFPNTPISLGCMRPGKKVRIQIDQYAIDAGINRIEIPTYRAIQYATQKGLEIRKYHSCCAVPINLL